MRGCLPRNGLPVHISIAREILSIASLHTLVKNEISPPPYAKKFFLLPSAPRVVSTCSWSADPALTMNPLALDVFKLQNPGLNSRHLRLLDLTTAVPLLCRDRQAPALRRESSSTLFLGEWCSSTSPLSCLMFQWSPSYTGSLT